MRLYCRPTRRRRGASLVELALICPAALLILFGLLVGGMGVARYQEVSHLARKAARYASTHGGMYQQEHIPLLDSVPSIATVNDPNLSSYVAANSVLCDSSRLTTNVSWTAPASYTPPNMPSYVDTSGNQNPPGQNVIQNNVVVTVSYQWLPEVYLLGPITLTCTCEMPMSY